MSPKINQQYMFRKSQGSALVQAIFIVTIMALLGATLVRVFSSNSETIAYEVIGTRALQAAQAGMQRKMAELFPLAPNVGVCSGSVEYDFSTIEGLKNCKAISVSCTPDANVAGVSYYTITSTGQCDVAGVLTSRTIEVKAKTL